MNNISCCEEFGELSYNESISCNGGFNADFMLGAACCFYVAAICVTALATAPLTGGASVAVGAVFIASYVGGSAGLCAGIAFK